MATAFDGLGMGQLGRESQYYSGTNPFREALKGLKDFAVVSGIQKSGLQDFLNNLGKDTTSSGVSPAAHGYSAARDAMIPGMSYDTQNTAAQAPAPEVVAPVLQDVNPLQKQADSAFGIQSSITPDSLKLRDTSLDQVPMQAASAPPPQMNMPKYGNQTNAIDLATIASIAKFFI